MCISHFFCAFTGFPLLGPRDTDKKKMSLVIPGTSKYVSAGCKWHERGAVRWERCFARVVRLFTLYGTVVGTTN